MVGLGNAQPYTFGALRQDVAALRRLSPLRCARAAPVSFSCSVCGSVATHIVTHPHNELGMGDYREDIRERPRCIPRLKLV